MDTTNEEQKNGACYGRGPFATDYLGLGLPDNGGAPVSGQDCDEYPFRVTVEGAESPDWDFSVRAVPASQNRSAGGRLGNYLTSDRILTYDDEFFVDVIDGGGPFPPAPATPLDAGPDVTGTEGSLIFLAGQADEFEPGTLHWSYQPVGAVDPGTSCTFTDPNSASTFIQCNDDGAFIATLTSDNGVDAAISDSAVVTVENAPPVLTLAGPNSWQLDRVGTPVTIQASFSDPGTNDSHTCAVNWDDATNDSYAPGGGNSCDRSHTFTRAGMFTMTVSVTDDDGGSDSASVMIVVYDPHGGFANADGSIATPAGSLTTSPGATVDDWFHLTAKYYQPNDTVPLGNAGTWVPGTDFRFDSGSVGLAWLVVTPDGKIAVRGTGSINGQAGYDSPDMFRVVVWDTRISADPERRYGF